MDLPAPVANTGTPPNMMQSLNMMGGLMNLKQSQIAIQQGQQRLAQEKIQTSRQQQLQDFYKNFDFESHIGDDGTVSLESAFSSPRFKGLDIAKPDAIEALQKIKGAQLQQKQQLANLDSTSLGQMASGVGALANDPDVKNDTPAGRGKVADFYAKFGAASPQNKRIADLYGNIVRHAPQGKLAEGVKAQQLMGADVLGQRSQQNPQPFAINTGAETQFGTVDPQSGQRAMGAGPPVPNAIGPTQTPEYIRAVGAAGTEGTAGAGNDEAVYNNIVASGTKATQIRSLADDVRHLAGEVQTGQYSKAFQAKWAAVAQTFGVSPENLTAATRRQLLGKMAAQLRMTAESGASTDAERGGIESAMPNPDEMTPEATQKAARYVGAQADIKSARMNIANQHRQMMGGTSTGLREVDSRFMQHADPRVFEYQQIPPGAERQQYLKEHFSSPAEIQDFVQKANALRSFGALK